jgi:hypothetical protein
MANMYFYTFSVYVEHLLHRLPVPCRELDRSLHQVLDGAGAAEGLPGDKEVARDQVQNPEGKREAGETAIVRYRRSIEHGKVRMKHF